MPGLETLAQVHSWEEGKVMLRSPGKSHPQGDPPLQQTPGRNKGHPQGQTLDCRAIPVAQTKRIPLADMPTPG